jgi:hypothetical protein
MKTALFILGMFLMLLLSFTWGQICGTYMRPEVAGLASLLGGLLIGLVGMMIVLKTRSLR